MTHNLRLNSMSEYHIPIMDSRISLTNQEEGILERMWDLRCDTLQRNDHLTFFDKLTKCFPYEFFSNQKTIGNLLKIRTYKHGATLISEDKNNASLFYVLIGIVVCTYQNHFITYASKDDFVGIIECLTGRLSCATVKAVSDCLCIELPMDKNTRQLLLSDPVFIKYHSECLGDIIKSNNKYFVTMTSGDPYLYESLICAYLSQKCKNSDTWCKPALSRFANDHNLNYHSVLRAVKALQGIKTNKSSPQLPVIIDTIGSSKKNPSYKIVDRKQLGLIADYLPNKEVFEGRFNIYSPYY